MNFLSGLPSQSKITLAQTKWTPEPYWRSRISEIIMRINLAILLIIFTSIHLWATGKAQTINLQLKNVTLEEALKQIGKQANYGYFFEKGTQTKSKNLNLNLSNATIKIALDQCFAEQPFTYELNNEIIVVKPKGFVEKVADFLKTITGNVTDDKGKPLAGVSINIKGGNRATITDADGDYKIEAEENSILIFSYVGYETQEVSVNTKKKISIILQQVIGQLDEVVARGYGTTTQRLSTGNIVVVKSEVIDQQAGVTNAMQAIIGRLPGVQATQINGMPGSGVSIKIRGRNSISASNDPLYIVDGVAFFSSSLAGLNTATSVSSLNSINPSDIESITILKDADATAIYGSRGANGVVLISTKKGQQGQLKLDVNFNNSYGVASRLATLMNTEEYLQLRRDAFVNSNINPTVTSAPDLISWDTNANTNLQEMYLGNTAKFWDGNLSFSGGNQGLTFLFATGLHKESTIRSNDDDYRRANVHLNMNYNSNDNKFKLSFNGFYSTDKFYLILGGGSTPVAFAKAVPNYPYFDKSGNYNWTAGLTNNIAQANLYWKSLNNNLNANFAISYEPIKNLVIQTNFGFNKIDNEVMRPQPLIGLNPSSGISSNGFGNTNTSSVLIEPQVTYHKALNKWKFDYLIGSTIQSNKTRQGQINVTNYINDLLIESINGGTIAGQTSNSTLYKYISLFSRATINRDEKYLLNLTFRKDGSTRFGPGKQFGNFYSLGSAWIFSNEKFIKQNISILSYGKLRASYGTTGNDGIGDYRYLSIYTPVSTNYETSPAIIPSQIANPDFRWEENRKLELALELGFFKNRLLLNSAYYRNRSSNQLVTYPLPSITGFAGYTANLPALIENKGWEFEVTSKNIIHNNFSWSTTANLTIPSNKLLSFPNIELTSYANSLIVGKSLNSVLLFQFLKVDPQTGLAQVADINKDNVFTGLSSYNNQGGDLINAGYTNAKWYGGMGNTFMYKNFELDFFFQYTRQDGYNLYSQSNGFTSFGMLNNSWQKFNNYWKKAGDEVEIPKPMAASSQELARFAFSTASFKDASFLRLKNVSIAYVLPKVKMQSIGLSNLKLYAQGLNLWTLTDYLGYDPESAASTSSTIPNLKMWTFGIQAIL